LSSFPTPAERRNSIVVLIAVCSAALILPLDFSGAAAATPAIGREFGGDPTALAWVVNAFMLAFGSTLLTAGALADAFGRKRAFRMGLVLFVIVSIAMCFSPGLVVLDLLRLIQGVGAAATLAGGSAALAQEFRQGLARARAFSLLGTTFGTGLAFGPTIAGVLIDSFGWRAIFLTGAIVGALALVFGVPRLRETRDPGAAGPDWPGAICFTASLALLTAGLLQAATSGWKGALVEGLLAGAGLGAVLFAAIELRSKRPMLDLTLFRYPRFVGVQLLPVATTCSYVVLLVLLPSRFIGIEGHPELQAGLMMLGLSAPMLIVPFVTASLTRWVGPHLLSCCGLLIAAAGLIWLAEIPVGSAAFRLTPAVLTIGLGTAMPWGLMDGLSVSVVPAERAGMATGIFSTVRVAGEGIALAIARALLASFSQRHLNGLTGPAATSDQIANMGAWLATGEVSRVSELLPSLGRASLQWVYAAAFRELLHVLTAIVVVSALAVLVMLGRSARDG
jgi:MFS family permease